MTVPLHMPATEFSEAATSGSRLRGFAVSDEIVEHLSAKAATLQRTCVFKPRPLPTGFGRVVVTTDDGLNVTDHLFEQYPTAQELVARAGPFAFVIAVRFKRLSLRRRLLLSVRLASTMRSALKNEAMSARHG